MRGPRSPWTPPAWPRGGPGPCGRHRRGWQARACGGVRPECRACTATAWHSRQRAPCGLPAPGEGRQGESRGECHQGPRNLSRSLQRGRAHAPLAPSVTEPESITGTPAFPFGEKTPQRLLLSRAAIHLRSLCLRDFGTDCTFGAGLGTGLSRRFQRLPRLLNPPPAVSTSNLTRGPSRKSNR